MDNKLCGPQDLVAQEVTICSLAYIFINKATLKSPPMKAPVEGNYQPIFSGMSYCRVSHPFPAPFIQNAPENSASKDGFITLCND